MIHRRELRFYLGVYRRGERGKPLKIVAFFPFLKFSPYNIYDLKSKNAEERLIILWRKRFN